MFSRDGLPQIFVDLQVQLVGWQYRYAECPQECKMYLKRHILKGKWDRFTAVIFGYFVVVLGWLSLFACYLTTAFIIYDA